MGRLEDEVRELILDRHRNLAEFARSIGIPEHTLYSALSNGLSGATLTTVMPIVNALGLDPGELMAGRLTISPKATVPVPLFGSIAAGKPVEPAAADCTFPIPIELHEAHPDAFMLRIEGNSMNRVLPDGFFALIAPCASIDVTGKLYAVTVGNGAATVKRVRLHDNGLTLEPDSLDPTYRPALFDYADENAEAVAVIGRVVWYCPPLDWGLRQER